MGSRFRKSERGGSRYTAGAEDQDAASSQSKLLLERAQNPDVIGIAAEERTVSPDNDRVNGTNLEQRADRILSNAAEWIACAESSR